jgi:hypothetical protein
MKYTRSVLNGKQIDVWLYFVGSNMTYQKRFGRDDLSQCLTQMLMDSSCVC